MFYMTQPQNLGNTAKLYIALTWYNGELCPGSQLELGFEGI